VKLTMKQLGDLRNRMNEAGVEEVEIVESDDGRLQYYTIETKVVRRPLRAKRKNGNGAE
jgi:hypothetical protein